MSPGSSALLQAGKLQGIAVKSVETQIKMRGLQKQTKNFLEAEGIGVYMANITKDKQKKEMIVCGRGLRHAG